MNAKQAVDHPWLINGHQSNTIAVDDRAVQYGDGLFETMRVCDQRIPLLTRHLNRLEFGCQRLGIAVNMTQLANDLQHYLLTLPVKKSFVLKLIVSRGSGARGYRPQKIAEPTVAMRAYAYSAPSNDQINNGVNARLCSTPLGCNPALAGMKHLNRIEQVLARAEWHDLEVFEGIMLDVNGYVIEGTMSNLFFVRDQTLFTPELSQCGVAGVMREELLAYFSRQSAKTAVEGRFNFQHLANASEVFITNSVIGVLSLRACEHLHWRTGEFANNARKHIDSLFTAENGAVSIGEIGA